MLKQNVHTEELERGIGGCRRSWMIRAEQQLALVSEGHAVLSVVVVGAGQAGQQVWTGARVHARGFSS
jgi:hypothetical protein